MLKKLPKPEKKQREVLYLSSNGCNAVLGTAGSGKTTLALYRAAYLSEPSMPHSGKTLLLTFNKALVTYLKYLKPRELKNFKIETYHTFARGYLNSRGKMQNNCICDPNLRKELIEKAVENIAAKYNPHKFFKRSSDFFMDEIQWIFSHGIENLEEYELVERVGRLGCYLPRKKRPVMYQILEEYLRLREARGKKYDWDDIALNVKKAFESDDSERFYKHIVLDEGQDFSPEMLRSLSTAIPKDGSLTFFGDVAQQIYGQRMSWRSAGLKISEKWEFLENYRNTMQIAQLGLAISSMPYFEDIPDMVRPTSSKADGPLPDVVKCKDIEAQVDVAVKVAKSYSATQRVAILLKNREQELLISNKVGAHGIRLHRDLGRWQEGPGIFHGTYHSAKGLEFDMVILPFLDSDNLPDKDYILSHGEDEALTRDGRLLYVAVTRARTRLLLLYSNEITPLLPKDNSLYTSVAE